MQGSRSLGYYSSRTVSSSVLLSYNPLPSGYKNTKRPQNAGITSKNGRNDAKRLNINVVTVTNDDKMKKRKTQ